MNEDMLATYGYWALFVGTFLEGETIVLIAGVAASQGLLDIRLVILSALLGSLFGDQLYFFIGRFNGGWLLARMPRLKVSIDRVLALLERHCVWLILTFRFMYGLRNVASFAIGLSRVRVWLFVTLNVIGASVWAVSFALSGYLFGEALLLIVEDARHYQREVLGGLCVLAALFWLYRQWRRRKVLARAARPTAATKD